jgi:dihydrofolate reductase
MGRVVVAEYVALDGVVEAPEKWVFPSWSDELANYTHAQLLASDALLLGRATYDIFAASWPSRTGDEHADRMNAIPKYVVSSTLERADWNNSTVLRGGVEQAVAEVKQKHERDVLVWGSGTLARELLAKGLADEYHLMLFPVVLGGGKKLFDGAVESQLSLVDSRATDKGVLILTYVPVAP